MREKGFATLIFVVIGALILVGIALVGYLYFKTQKSSSITQTSKKVSKSEWVGIIATKDGLVKINSQGVLERDSNSKVKTFVPPGFRPEDVFNLKLLDDGRLAFVGSSQTSSNFKENAIYIWEIDSQGNPAPLLKLADGQKIRSFAVSPDSRQVALISVTRTSDELHEGLGSSELESTKKQLEEREKQLQEELRTVLIYDVKTGQVIKELKKKLLDPPSRRTGGGRLLWNKNGLFVLDKPEIILFDSKSWGVIETIPDIQTGPVTSLVDTILISPDGKKYYSQYTVKKIPGNERISQFDFSYLSRAKLVNLEELKEPIDEKEDLENKVFWDGPQAFSPDSEKVLIQGRNNSQTNFTILELDLKSGKTQKIGDSELIELEPTTKVKSVFLFLTYSPLGDRIYFAAYPTGDPTSSTDLYQLKKGEQKAEFMDSYSGLDVSFLGWYLSAAN